MSDLGDSPAMIRAVRVVGPGSELQVSDEPVDLVLEGGQMADIAPTGVLRAHGEVFDADGAWVIPGLWDNHVHAVQWALASEREPLGEASSADEAARRMASVPARADGRRIGTGFRDALWPDSPSRELLDAACGEVPTYLINADVHSVWLNSAALRREGFRADDGMLREEDAFEISRRLNAVDPAHADEAVIRAGQDAAARGITGIVDFDMAWNAEAWARRAAAGFDSHRVEFAVYQAELDRAIDEGLRTGDLLDGTLGLARMGSLKIISDGSLGTRTAACSHAYPDDPDNFGVLTIPPGHLLELLVRATGAGLAVAVHAIGDRAVSSALDAFTISDARGTLEHAQLVRHSDLTRMGRLDVTASVQPQHALDDRDMVRSYWGEQTAIGYPMSSLLSAGVQLRLGSDAPVAPLDPWQAISAAVMRTDDERDAWRPEERLSVSQALEASVRTAVRPGHAADLAIIAEDPAAASPERLRAMPVLATLLGGRVTHVV